MPVSHKPMLALLGIVSDIVNPDSLILARVMQESVSIRHFRLISILTTASVRIKLTLIR